MGMNREKAHEVFARYETVKRRVSDLQDIVRNPDYVTEELTAGMLSESNRQTQLITTELNELQKEIECLLQELSVKKEKKPSVINNGDLVKLVVDCEENNPVDISCGGPRMLGFDFFVTKTESDSLIEEIKVLLQKYKRPLLDIDTVPCILGKQYILWCKDTMEESIKEGY